MAQLDRLCVGLMRDAGAINIDGLQSLPGDVRRRTGRLLDGLVAVEDDQVNQKTIQHLKALSNHLAWPLALSGDPIKPIPFMPFAPEPALPVINLWQVYGFPSMFEMAERLQSRCRRLDKTA